MPNGFTDAEVAYLSSQRLGRLATITGPGRPHVVPMMFRLDPGEGVPELGARDLPDRGQRRSYRRDIEVNPWVAFVVDDVLSIDPWTPRGVSIRGRAEIEESGGERLGPGFGPIWVRIVPTWISSWGVDNGSYDPPTARAVG